MAKTETIVEKETRHFVTVTENSEVVGRAEIIKSTTGRAELLLIQTYGGSAEGTLKAPIKADVEVVRAFLRAADTIRPPS